MIYSPLSLNFCQTAAHLSHASSGSFPFMISILYFYSVVLKLLPILNGFHNETCLFNLYELSNVCTTHLWSTSFFYYCHSNQIIEPLKTSAVFNYPNPFANLKPPRPCVVSNCLSNITPHLVSEQTANSLFLHQFLITKTKFIVHAFAITQ